MPSCSRRRAVRRDSISTASVSRLRSDGNLLGADVNLAPQAECRDLRRQDFALRRPALPQDDSVKLCQNFVGHRARWTTPPKRSLDGAPFRLKSNAKIWALRTGSHALIDQDWGSVRVHNEETCWATPIPIWKSFCCGQQKCAVLLSPQPFGFLQSSLINLRYQ